MKIIAIPRLHRFIALSLVTAAPLLISGCAATGTSIDYKIPVSKMAIMPVVSKLPQDVHPNYGLSTEELDTFTSVQQSAMVQSQYFDIISRSDMEQIMKEQKFQMSSASAESEKLFELGKIMAVKYLVVTEIGGLVQKNIMGNKVVPQYTVTAKLLDINLGRIIGSTTQTFKSKQRLFTAMNTCSAELRDQYVEKQRIAHMRKQDKPGSPVKR